MDLEKVAQDARDAARYRWLRDLLAVEDIARLVDERAQYPWSTPDPAESAKADAAVDEAMALELGIKYEQTIGIDAAEPVPGVVTPEMISDVERQPDFVRLPLTEALREIEKAAAKNKRRADLHMDFWARYGCSWTSEYKQACELLKKHGFAVQFFYEERQFVNMFTIVEW